MESIFCIIGAGMSGLVSAKYCLENNYKIIILEKNSDIGGVWLSKSYENVKLQSTKYSYGYSDFPHFKNTNLYPSRNEILNYLREYCNKHNLLKFCKFNSEVLSTNFNSSNKKWLIKFKDNQGIRKINVDYLVVASGFYTNVKIPNIIKEKTEKTIHSSKFSYTGDKKASEFKNKDVVIIGNGPTGCDLAVLAVKSKAKSVKILYRSKRWLFRRFLWKKFSTDNFLSRFMMELGNLAPKLLYIIVIIINYYIFYLFSHGIFSLKVLPPFKTINRQNLVLNDNILEMVEQGKIKYIQTKDINIYDNLIIFDGKHIKYDMCVLATGYKSDIKFLGMDSIPYLYKRIIHPDYPNCCFIGFAASFNWIQVSELQIQWYLKFINNNSTSRQNMIKDINNVKDNLSSKEHDYHDLSILAFKYCDNLAKYIGIKQKYSKLNPRHWFISPEYNLWSINNS